MGLDPDHKFTKVIRVFHGLFLKIIIHKAFGPLSV
jgi:hypothetical protein